MQTLIRIFVGIMTTMSHVQERQAIRETWLHPSAVPESLDIVYEFFIGKTNVTTQLAETDIHVIEWLEDNYYTITNKTYAILQRAHELSGFDYVFKVDDDAYVNFTKLHAELEQCRSHKHIYIGKKIETSTPFRDPSHRWYVSPSRYRRTRYPKYAQGHFYGISGSILSWLMERGSLSRRMTMEDVAVGLWLERFRIATRTSIKDCILNERFDAEKCNNETISSHHMSADDMHVLFKTNACPMKPKDISEEIFEMPDESRPHL